MSARSKLLWRGLAAARPAVLSIEDPLQRELWLWRGAALAGKANLIQSGEVKPRRAVQDAGQGPVFEQHPGQGSGCPHFSVGTCVGWFPRQKTPPESRRRRLGLPDGISSLPHCCWTTRSLSAAPCRARLPREPRCPPLHPHRLPQGKAGTITPASAAAGSSCAPVCACVWQRMRFLARGAGP